MLIKYPCDYSVLTINHGLIQPNSITDVFLMFETQQPGMVICFLL